MVELTLQVSNSFAKKIQSFGVWTDVILELNLEDFKNDSVKRAKSDLLKFLTKNPTAYEVLEFSLSEKFQDRVDYLLDLNGESSLKSADQKDCELLRPMRAEDEDALDVARATGAGDE